MESDIDTTGQDAFLDVVANLVGILIILVVLVGAQAATDRTKDNSAATSAAAQLSELTRETQARFSESENLQLENTELGQKHAEEREITNQLAGIRQQLLIRIETARRAIEAGKSELSVQHRASLIVSTELESLKQKIRQVQFESRAVKQQLQPIIETIVHYPTPIAKTVFSDEIHFRILGGRVVHVPLEELVDAMRNKWQLSAAKMLNADDIWETVGPIGDFRLQYLLSIVEDRSQYPVQQTAQLQRFVLQPTGQNIGEGIEQLLQGGSEFGQQISRLNPKKTTVSFWVYPDGYGHLAVIRAWLREAGFQTASWPLEYGGLISGGPQGFRTTTN